MKRIKKFLCLMLAAAMVLMTSACKNKSEQETKAEPVNITVYTDSGSFSGVMDGWSGQLLKDRLNITVTVKYVEDFTTDELSEGVENGDIFMFFSDAADSAYYKAVQNGLLMSLDDNAYIEKYGKNILKYESDMMAANRLLTSEITGGESDTCYGFNGGLVASGSYYKASYVRWSVRWDLYKRLGYPEVKDLDDMVEVLKAMKGLQPVSYDDDVYAVSLDNSYELELFYNCLNIASDYFGCGAMNMGMYSPISDEYYEVLEDGPYLKILKFLNKLYQNGLLDPESVDQDVNRIHQKVKNGEVLCQIIDYYEEYNTEYNLNMGDYMYALIPDEAVYTCEKVSNSANPRILSVGAHTQHPELCIQFLDYFVSPEGFLELTYGPKGVLWDMGEDGLPYLTDYATELSEEDGYFGYIKFEYNGSYYDYKNGVQPFNLFTWDTDSLIPDTDGRTTFDYRSWKNYTVKSKYKIQQDWINHTGYSDINDYFYKNENVAYFDINVSESTAYTEESMETVYAVQNIISKYGWDAVYADTDEKFDAIVAEMKEAAIEAGYNDIVALDRQILTEYK